MKYITEGLQYMDMEKQITPILGVDEFKSTIGEDKDFIVLNFTVNGKQVGEDLSNWCERGYEWVVDAEISPGEVLDKKYYVFVEMQRRSSAPKRICEMIDDLYTLCGVKQNEWKVKIDGHHHPLTEKTLEKHLILNSRQYEIDDEKGLNEWREIAGIKIQSKTSPIDDDLIQWQRQAGIK